MSRLVAASWLLALLLCGITSTTTASSAPAASSTDGTAAAAVSHYAMNGFDELAKGAVVPEDHFVCGPADKCYCSAWLHSRGTPGEKIGAQVCQWIAFSIAIALLTFYGFSAWKATCGWEEVYVCCVEVLFVTLEIFKEFSSPATVYLSTGNHAYCLRYFEWLLSCPVILIKLSNLSGLKNDYSKRTMGLIVSCVGMIVFGMAAGLATDWLKWLLYIVSCIYGGYMYFQAAKCYVEANHSVPKGHCRMVVKLMAYAYFASWGSYPILWAVGPEGLLKLSPYANSIGHSICDIIAKEFWTFLAHHLRIKIHEHILIHGDIRKTTKMEIGGEEVEVEEFVEEEDEDTV
nr:CsChrimson [synthetic construct]